MTTTILRHELYRTVRPLLAIVGIAVLVIALADFAGMFIGVIGLVLAAMVAAMMLPAVQLFHAIDFYQSSYGSGAMLTHLLPISGRKLFWTKLLYAVLITTLTGIVSLAIILLQVRLGMAAVDLNLTEAYTELQQIFTTPGIWAAIVFFALWVLLVPLVSMFPSVVIGSGGWARRLSFGGPIIVFMGYYLVMQLVGVASLFMPPVYDFFTGQVRMVSLWHVIAINDPNPAMPLAIFGFQLVALAALLIWASRAMNSKVELR
ncbi:MAG TPA: hypothetical protein H9884_01595 [Candidatus Yaniella excrementigallinarum]|nr:hypothetical protein [Candidatus Yaniella excrementigallinarum]